MNARGWMSVYECRWYRTWLVDYPDGGKEIRPSRVHGLRDAGSSSIQGSLLFPFPFPLGSLSWFCSPAARWARPDDDEDSAPLHEGSHKRMVKSSEQDANICVFLGFHATEFTLPLPWPVRTSRRIARSRCQIYTFPSNNTPHVGLTIWVNQSKRTKNRTMYLRFH